MFFMKQGSTLFLKIAVIILVFPFWLVFYLLPQIANVAFEEAANCEIAYIVYGNFNRYVCFGDTVFVHCIRHLNF